MQNLDPAVGLAKLLALLIGTELALALAPQLAVFLGGCAGGVIGLMAWRQCSRIEGCGYVVGMGFLAWMLTGMLTALLIGETQTLADKQIASGVAVSIGAIGHRWPLFAKHLRGLLLVALRSGGKR